MRWTIKPKPTQTDIDVLSEALHVDGLIAQLLIQRGITNYKAAKKFFRPQLSDLHDPFLMKDMDVAVARIQRAITDNENIWLDNIIRRINMLEGHNPQETENKRAICFNALFQASLRKRPFNLFHRKNLNIRCEFLFKIRCLALDKSKKLCQNL